MLTYGKRAGARTGKIDHVSQGFFWTGIPDGPEQEGDLAYGAPCFLLFRHDMDSLPTRLHNDITRVSVDEAYVAAHYFEAPMFFALDRRQRFTGGNLFLYPPSVCAFIDESEVEPNEDRDWLFAVIRDLCPTFPEEDGRSFSQVDPGYLAGMARAYHNILSRMPPEHKERRYLLEKAFGYSDQDEYIEDQRAQAQSGYAGVEFERERLSGDDPTSYALRIMASLMVDPRLYLTYTGELLYSNALAATLTESLNDMRIAGANMISLHGSAVQRTATSVPGILHEVAHALLLADVNALPDTYGICVEDAARFFDDARGVTKMLGIVVALLNEWCTALYGANWTHDNIEAVLTTGVEPAVRSSYRR